MGPYRLAYRDYCHRDLRSTGVSNRKFTAHHPQIIIKIEELRERMFMRYLLLISIWSAMSLGTAAAIADPLQPPMNQGEVFNSGTRDGVIWQSQIIGIFKTNKKDWYRVLTQTLVKEPEKRFQPKIKRHWSLVSCSTQPAVKFVTKSLFQHRLQAHQLGEPGRCFEPYRGIELGAKRTVVPSAYEPSCDLWFAVCRNPYWVLEDLDEFRNDLKVPRELRIE
jgi:hypothetical protein